MIFDTETAILARLAAKCAPGSVLLGTFDPVDVSDAVSYTHLTLPTSDLV